MKQLKDIKHLLLIFMDILGEGFSELLELKPGTYRNKKNKITHATTLNPIKDFIRNAEIQIQKLAKTQVIIKDNEIYCRDTGSDKLLVPFLFIDEYIHLLNLLVFDGLPDSNTFEDILNLCLFWCNCHDDSFLQEPDNNTELLLEMKLISQEQYNQFMEFKRRSFRKEYYSACRDVINNRKEGKSFYDWPVRKVSETIKTIDWNNDDDIVSSRTVDRMKNKPGLRRWGSIKNIISVNACDRYREEETLLKEYEVFQARILMAYFLENLVNSEVLLKEYTQDHLYELLKTGLCYKP